MRPHLALLGLMWKVIGNYKHLLLTFIIFILLLKEILKLHCTGNKLSSPEFLYCLIVIYLLVSCLEAILWLIGAVFTSVSKGINHLFEFWGFCSGVVEVRAFRVVMLHCWVGWSWCGLRAALLCLVPRVRVHE